MVLQLVYSAVKQRSIGEVRVAAKQLGQILDQYPNSVEGHRAYIETKAMLGQIAEVQGVYKDLSTKNPANAVYRYGFGLAMSYSTPPNFPQVIQILEGAVNLEPGISYFHQTLGWAYEQYERTGKQEGYFEKAEEEYRIALELNDGFQFPESEGNLLLNLGNVFMALGNYHEAYRHYKQREDLHLSVRDDVTEQRYQMNFGEAAFKAGRTDESIAHYQASLKLLPEDKQQQRTQVLERIGLSYQDKGEYGEAVRYFSEALELNLTSGTTQNVAILRRNIGVNLYNLSLSGEEVRRESLKEALKSYFSSLEAINQFGLREKTKGSGLFQLRLALGGGGSEAATGFDRRGEEKLMFSYIASTYEKLSEAQSAREFYLKKLSLLDENRSRSSDVGVLTEKAVVCNRLGVLSHQMGERDEAMEFLSRSLQHTRQVGLDYGTAVNLYNMSRIASEVRLEGQSVDQALLDTLMSGIDEVTRRNTGGRLSVYLLANVAFLLSDFPIPGPSNGDTVRETAERYHRAYDARRRAVAYYQQAVHLVEEQKVIPMAEALRALLPLKLNLMGLALQAGMPDRYKVLQEEIYALVETSHTNEDWVVFLLQAEQATNDTEREKLLTRAFKTLMALPPQAYPRLDHAQSSLPLFDALAVLYTDLLVERGEYAKAFSVSEQIEMRKVTTRLYNMVGEEFFLSGLGEYRNELRTLLGDMRTAVREGKSGTLEGLASQFEEVIFALYEEYPWAVSYFSPYAPTERILSEALSAQQPYVKAVQGRQSGHLFVHDGKEVHYYSLDSRSGGVQPLKISGLSKASSVYLATLPHVEHPAFFSALKGKTITRVQSVYDVLNARSQRNLFYSRIVFVGALELPQVRSEGVVPISVRTVSAKADGDQELLSNLDVFVAAGPVEGLAFEINKELAVREFIQVQDLSSSQRHSAILLNLGVDDAFQQGVVVSALIRAGFPHVVVNHGPYDPEVSRKFVSSYLSHLAKVRPDEAVARASAEALGRDGQEGRDGAFMLYGFAGMNEEEKTGYASAVYSESVSDAVAMYQGNDYQGALKAFENALSLIPFTSSQQDVPKLRKLAVDTAFKIEDYQKAVFHQTKLLEDVDQRQDLQEKPEVLYRLGILYSRLEQFEPSIKYLEEAINLWKKREELDRLAEGISTLGVVKENMGAYPDALDAFGRSFELYEELGESGDVAGQYRRIGRIHYLRLNRYERARENFVAAAQAYRQLGNQRAEAETLFEVGLTFEKVGLFDEADARYVEGREIGLKLRDPFLIATGELYLANTAWFRGQYQEAFEHLTKANEEAEKASDAQLTIMIANTRGLIYWTLNDLDKGLVHLKRGLTLAERENIKTEVASTLNNLGLMYRERGDLEASLLHFERAKDIDQQLNSRWGLGYDYRNIGMSLMKLKRYAEAENNFLQAERTSAEIKNTTNWVKALLELGNLNRALTKPEIAQEYYEKAYQLSERYGIQEVLWRSAAGKAALMRSSGKYDDAFTWYAKAVSIVEGMRASLKIEEFRNSFQVNKQDLYQEIISLLVEMGRTPEAFNYLERSRSRSFIDLLGNQKLTLKSAVDQKQLDTMSTLSLRVEALGREVGSFEKPPEELLDRYRQAKTDYEEALLALKQSNPALSSFVAVDPLIQADVERMLGPEVGLLSYNLAGDKVYIWLVKASGTKFYAVPKQQRDIEDTVKRYRELVQRLEPVGDELKELYQSLILPVEKDLEGVKYLGIIPDGVLHFLSFAALRSPDGYVVDRYPIFYAPSASVLKYTFAKRGKTKQSKVLAVGNPDLGNYNYDLPLAELEAKSIRWNFPEMDILTGRKATKEWLVKNISKYGIIHLAAHGEFDEFNPLLSSLWLASEDPENRRLSVKEVFALDIRADLVTLSACQTGLGKLEAGELIGLNRAFIYAGTHALVSALWRVDDLSTSVLMKHFYRHYVRMNKAESLRQAQLIVKREFPHPSYWAGMTLVGDYQ